MGRVKTLRTKADMDCSHTAISHATPYSNFTVTHHSRADTRKCSIERGNENYLNWRQFRWQAWRNGTGPHSFVTLFIQEERVACKRELQATEHHKSGMEVFDLRVHPMAKSYDVFLLVGIQIRQWPLQKHWTVWSQVYQRQIYFRCITSSSYWPLY